MVFAGRGGSLPHTPTDGTASNEDFSSVGMAARVASFPTIVPEKTTEEAPVVPVAGLARSVKEGNSWVNTRTCWPCDLGLVCCSLIKQAGDGIPHGTGGDASVASLAGLRGK